MRQRSSIHIVPFRLYLYGYTRCVDTMGLDLCDFVHGDVGFYLYGE